MNTCILVLLSFQAHKHVHARLLAAAACKLYLYFIGFRVQGKKYEQCLRTTEPQL